MRSRLATLIVVAIVAGTFVIGLIVGAQRDDETGPVDLIVLNGRIYTADGSGRFAEALAVRGNTILRVGSNREVKRLAGRSTETIDAHGASVLPGLNDAHLHLVSGGLGLQQANLLDASTLEEIGAAIEAFAAAHPDRPWVLGRGWYYTPFPGGLPTRQQLDALVPDRPAYMRCYDGHTAWVNTLALKAAGITRETPDPPGGVVVRDPATGDPTGVLKEAAQELVARHLPEWTRDDRLRAIGDAIAKAHELGVTSAQNAGVDEAEVELYDELLKKGDLQLRLYNAISIEPPFTAADADRLDGLWKRRPDDALVKMGAVKLMLDGVIESHTAAMLEPYANRPATGLPNMDAATLNGIVAMMDRRGWQVLVHAIGDAAVRQSLDAFEHAAAVNPVPARGRRHRIEHVETLQPSDVPRFGRLGVVAVQQPFHGNPNPTQLAVWSANLGPERASRGWAQRSILDAGGRLAMGTDWPVVTLDPRYQINMAINRTTPEGTPPGGWLPEQRLTLASAVDAYTTGAAYASFDERRKGQLVPGMLADIVVLSTDVFANAPEKFLDAEVAVTIFDGKVVYRKTQP
ncbi:MAG TPA: amidohydrolase [Vicinamibacterales bacterium]|nr:amidohydrolase [Vicinamibacterales bacterium]